MGMIVRFIDNNLELYSQVGNQSCDGDLKYSMNEIKLRTALLFI